MTHITLSNVKLVALCVLVLLTSTLFGCGKNNLAQVFNEYQQRMANVLDTPFEANSNDGTITLNYPPKRELVSAIEIPQIDVKQFFALNKCEVNVLIAQRNTPLGRTQLPSVRYLYERNMLSALAHCIQLMPEQRVNLESWITQKRRILPLVWANLIQTSDEIINALGNNSDFITSLSSSDIQQTQSALTYLLQLKQHPQVILVPAELEQHLQQLSKLHLPAKAWRTQALMTNELTTTTTWLKQQNLLTKCPDGQASQNILYLKNVFTLWFIEKIQPIAGQLNNVQYTLLPLYQSMSQQPELTPQFRQFLAQHSQISFSAYQQAIQEHVLFWQQLFKHCSISPRVSTK
ncbi:MAG: DUF3080 family protein [Paraglaciecola polaris]